jgi:hypothetical protein
MASQALPDELKFLLDQGCRLLPGNDKKYCPMTDWQRKASDDAHQVAEWLAKQPPSWLMQTGARASGGSNRIVIDFDQPGARASLEREVGILPATLSVDTRRGLHLHYETTKFFHGTKGSDPSGIGIGIDIRAWHNVAVIPPTSPYRYNYRPVVPLPDSLAELIHRRWRDAHTPEPKPSQPFAVAPVHLDVAGQHYGFRALLPGKRTKGLLRSLGKLQRKSIAPDQIKTILLIENQQRCHPPLPEQKVIALIDDISHRYSPAIGPDPLNLAWSRLSFCAAATTSHKFRSLALELQRAQPDSPIVLPQQRIAALLDVGQRVVSRICQSSVANGFLQKVGNYVPHEKAQSFLLDPTKTKDYPRGG